ncbi:MAG: hypothetical protein OXB88_07230 [Bacteriovoracales bacterium]|nr:hypothetical protein [Bacteriovoracales bacterium]
MTDFEPTEEESKALDEEVKEMLANAKTVTREEEIEECREALDKYCKHFGASSYEELVCWADGGGTRNISGEASVDILIKYSTFKDVRIKYEEEEHGEEARKLA